jgi:hypothetical protein
VEESSAALTRRPANRRRASPDWPRHQTEHNQIPVAIVKRHSRRRDMHCKLTLDYGALRRKCFEGGRDIHVLASAVDGVSSLVDIIAPAARVRSSQSSLRLVLPTLLFERREAAFDTICLADFHPHPLPSRLINARGVLCHVAL